MKTKTMVWIVLFVAVSLVQADYYPREDYLPQSYDNAHLARINFCTGEAYVTRSFEEGWEEAVENLAVFNRDILGTTYGRLELYLGRINFLRLDYDSEVVLEEAPGMGRTGTTIRIVRGGIYLNVNQLDSPRDIQVQTPDCGIFILQNGRYRINVYNQEGTEIHVISGLADVAGEFRDFQLPSMHAMTMVAGDSYQTPFMINRYSMDGFGMWNVERDRLINSSLGYRSRYLDPMFAHYEYELERWGRWIFQPAYGKYVWIPNHRDPRWRPYYRGRWLFHPVYGYVWTSYDPWGWMTHHYGRWQWSPNYGWYWIPGKKWSPAWVAWSWTDSYCGWCPLGMENRPVIIINNQWLKNYRFRSGLPFQSSSLVVVRRDQLWTPRIQFAALSGGELSKLSNKRMGFMGRHPKWIPDTRKVEVISARGKPVEYKKRGFLSPEKYRKPPRYDQKVRKQIERYSNPEKRISLRKDQENKYRQMNKSQKIYRAPDQKQQIPDGKKEEVLKQREYGKETGNQKRETLKREMPKTRKQSNQKAYPIKREAAPQVKSKKSLQDGYRKETEKKKREAMTRKAPETGKQKNTVKKSPDRSEQKKKTEGDKKKKKQKDSDKNKGKNKSKKKKDDDG